MEAGNGSEMQEAKSDRKSGLGIASCVLALIAIAFNVWLIVPLFSPENRQSLAWAWPPFWVVIFCLPLPINTVGLILGLRERTRGGNIYSTLGIIGNAIAYIPVLLGLLLLLSV